MNENSGRNGCGVGPPDGLGAAITTRFRSVSVLTTIGSFAGGVVCGLLVDRQQLALRGASTLVVAVSMASVDLICQADRR